MGDLEILSPLTQSILQWDKGCTDESVDNFDLSMTMNGNGQDNSDGFIDHTFHTPSFGDEEFDIPPIHLPPTTPTSDTNSNDVYGSTQPLSHGDQPSPHQPQHQQHLMSPPPQSPCSLGPSSPFAAQSHMQQQQQQSLQQQQHQYSNGGQHANDMYMLQVAPGSMMPPQSMQFHNVQQYSVPTSYQNSPMQQPSHLHMQHPVPHLQQHHGMLHHHPHHHQQQLLPPSPMMALHRHQRAGSVGSSPPGSNHTSPGLETSEDSDDSGHLSQLLCGMKRPSPEPLERPPSVGKPVKKPKVQKKKKKRDPNEPQKPVSAYALFFRDTQAAIKGQNPNASFGEVSKIVASMWDGLDVDHKNVYKKKTEAAKKEYLKALAAYRASLVSKAANDPSDSIYGQGSMGGQSLSPLQKKSPLLTSLMEGNNAMHNQQSMLMAQGHMSGGGHHPHMMSQPPSHHPMLHQMLSPGQQQQQQQMMHMGSPPPQHMMQQQQQHPMQQLQSLTNNNSLNYNANMPPGGMMQQNGCSRPGESGTAQEWDNRDYCNSNDCVVSHCRDVYTTWVAARPPQNSYASVK